MAIIYWIGGDSGNETDFQTAANWSTASVPTTGDEVFIVGRDTDYDIADGLDNSAILLARTVIDNSYTGNIGLENAYLELPSTILEIGAQVVGSGNGSGRINLDLGTDATTITIYNSALTATDSGNYPIRILAANASNILRSLGGTCSIALKADESSNFPLIEINGGIVVLGESADAAVITNTGGELVSYDLPSSPTKTLTSLKLFNSATATLYGSSTIGTLENWSNSRFNKFSTGTISTLRVGDGATFDASLDTSPITITNCELYTNATLDLRSGKKNVTFTNPVQLIGTTPQSVNILTNEGYTVALA